MLLRNKVLVQALKWRIKFLQSKYDYRDDKFILEHENDKSIIWLEYYHKRQHDRDLIMSKIYKCQDIMREIEEETPKVEVSIDDKVIGVLFVVFIALSCYGLTWFNEIIR